MVKPLYDYQLSDAEIRAIGLIMIETAQIEFLTDTSISSLTRKGFLPADTDPLGKGMQWKIQQLKAAARCGVDPAVAHLIAEFRWAMVSVQKLRNMLAHGILMPDRSGGQTLWSQWKLTEMPLDEIANRQPVVHYACHVASHLAWTLLQMEPRRPLPDRP